MSINKAILIGHLGSDPEIKYLDAERVVANFSLATNESYIDKEGNKVKQTEWHRIELWDGLAKIAEKYLVKGKLIYVEGKIKTDHWTDKDGIERYSTKIRGVSLQMIGTSERDEKPSTENSSTSSEPNTGQEGLNSGDLNDLPF